MKISSTTSRDLQALLGQHALSDLFAFECDLLQQLKEHHLNTYLHCLQVAYLSLLIGKRLNFSELILTELGWAALLHDIGKLRISSSILNNGGKLTPQELKIMEKHPAETLKVIERKRFHNLQEWIRFIPAFEHHQRYDRQGYPAVCGNKLSLHPFSRLIAIVDAYDAMTSAHTYQNRILPDIALQVLAQGFGVIFDPFILQVFITGMGAYPVGTLVRLSNDQLALVLRYLDHSEMNRPVVRKIQADSSITDLDLMDPSHQSLRIINSEFPENSGIEIKRILNKG